MTYFQPLRGTRTSPCLQSSTTKNIDRSAPNDECPNTSTRAKAITALTPGWPMRIQSSAITSFTSSSNSEGKKCSHFLWNFIIMDQNPQQLARKTMQYATAWGLQWSGFWRILGLNWSAEIRRRGLADSFCQRSRRTVKAIFNTKHIHPKNIGWKILSFEFVNPTRWR